MELFLHLCLQCLCDYGFLFKGRALELVDIFPSRDKNLMTAKQSEGCEALRYDSNMSGDALSTHCKMNENGKRVG